MIKKRNIIIKKLKGSISLLRKTRIYLLGICLCIVIRSQAQEIGLKESLILLRENSLLLKSQKYNIDIYKTYITTAQLRPNPLFNNQNISLLNHKNSIPSSSIPSTSSTNIFDSRNNQLWFQLTKPMQLGDLRNKKISLAEKGYETSLLDYESTVSDISFDIGNAWVELWSLQKKINIYKEVKEINDSIVYFNSIKLKNGYITQVDYERIELISNMFNIKISTLKLELSNNLVTFKQKLGIQDSLIIKVEDSLDSYILPKTLDSIIEIGIISRADLKVANSNSQYYKNNITLQKALAYPLVEGGVIYNPQNSVSYAGTYITAPIPVFDRNQGGIQQSKILYNQSEVYITSKVLKAINEITNAYTSYSIKKESIIRFNEMAYKSNKIFKSVRYTYQRGNTSILDLLEAEKTYLQLSLLFIENEYLYRKSYIDLLYSTGLLNKI